MKKKNLVQRNKQGGFPKGSQRRAQRKTAAVLLAGGMSIQAFLNPVSAAENAADKQQQTEAMETETEARLSEVIEAESAQIEAVEAETEVRTLGDVSAEESGPETVSAEKSGPEAGTEAAAPENPSEAGADAAEPAEELAGTSEVSDEISTEAATEASDAELTDIM